MTHPCPRAPPGQNSRWREWRTKVSGGALIPANCLVPGGKRNPGPHFALIPGSKQAEQTAWLPDARQGEGALSGSRADTPAWTADIPPLGGIYTSGLTHPATLLTPTPEPLATVPTAQPLPFWVKLRLGLFFSFWGLAVFPRPPKANR